MEIRKKITWLFIAIASFIMLLSSLAIYISFSELRREEFYDRMASKGKLVAQMLIEIDEIDTELLRKIEKNNPLSLPNEQVVVFDYKNEILYRSGGDSTFNPEENLIDFVRLHQDVKLKQEGYEVVGEFYTGPYDRIVVFVAAKDIFGLGKLKRLRFILLLVFVASLVLVFFAGRVFATRALQPISDLIEEVDRTSGSNLRTRLNEGNGKDEISRLAHTFNLFLSRLEASFNMQKSFIANASHELRTPLTVMRGQLEVLLLKPRQTHEYVESLNATLNEIIELTDKTNRLLLLAQASTEPQERNISPCRIDDITWQARQDVLKHYPEKTVEVEYLGDVSEERVLVVNGNELLLRAAILNLLDNACKFSEKKPVKIEIEPMKDNRVEVRVIDQGIGISATEMKTVFQPFFRSSQVRNIKGSGIGLSLVEKIMDMHQGQILVNSTPGQGSVFILSLPTAN